MIGNEAGASAPFRRFCSKAMAMTGHSTLDPDEFERAFPDGEVTHVLQVTTEGPSRPAATSSRSWTREVAIWNRCMCPAARAASTADFGSAASAQALRDALATNSPPALAS